MSDEGIMSTPRVEVSSVHESNNESAAKKKVKRADGSMCFCFITQLVLSYVHRFFTISCVQSVLSENLFVELSIGLLELGALISQYRNTLLLRKFHYGRIYVLIAKDNTVREP